MAPIDGTGISDSNQWLLDKVDDKVPKSVFRMWAMIPTAIIGILLLFIITQAISNSNSSIAFKSEIARLDRRMDASDKKVNTCEERSRSFQATIQQMILDKAIDKRETELYRNNINEKVKVFEVFVKGADVFMDKADQFKQDASTLAGILRKIKRDHSIK